MNTSLTFRETASSVSSCRIRRLAAASSTAWSVLSPSISPRSMRPVFQLWRAGLPEHAAQAGIYEAN